MPHRWIKTTNEVASIYSGREKENDSALWTAFSSGRDADFGSLITFGFRPKLCFCFTETGGAWQGQLPAGPSGIIPF